MCHLYPPEIAMPEIVDHHCVVRSGTGVPKLWPFLSPQFINRREEVFSETELRAYGVLGN
jgi:hypothetical protein